MFAMQIGMTRIGNGGRVAPRTRLGRIASVIGLVLTETEPVEYVIGCARRVTKSASAAVQFVFALAILVVSAPVAAVVHPLYMRAYRAISRFVNGVTNYSRKGSYEGTY